MFEEAIKKNKKAIFPIAQGKSETDSISFQVCGTGFFVNNKGYFISATHILDRDRSGDYFRLDVSDENKLSWFKIDIVAQNINSDILLGRVAFTSNEFLSFAEKSPIGRSVCIAGYTFGQLKNQYYQPSMIIDDNVKTTVDLGGFSRNYEGILLSDPGLSGLSGGPVFDKEGLVHGMQVLTSNRQASNLIVHNALAVKASNLQEFVELNESQRENIS